MAFVCLVPLWWKNAVRGPNEGCGVGHTGPPTLSGSVRISVCEASSGSVAEGQTLGNYFHFHESGAARHGGWAFTDHIPIAVLGV
jgi:hypothetical protein